MVIRLVRSDTQSTSGYSGYCTFVYTNLVTWRSKKYVVAHSSAEVEYRAMVHTTSEMLSVRSLLLDFGIVVPTPMKMFCDNQAVIFMLVIQFPMKRTKHVEVDCHIIRDLMM